MNSKFIFVLILICALLITVVFLKRGGDTVVSLDQQVEFASLIPMDIDTSQVTQLEFFAGVHPLQRTVMTRKDDEWRMLSFYNALVDPARPTRMLRAVTEFQGEFRAEVSDEQLADYDLSNERAFHIRGFVEGKDQPLFHLLAGKSPKKGDLFMRAAGSNSVYVVNRNIRYGAYLKTDEYDEIPGYDQWLDKRIVYEPGAVYTKLEFTMTDKVLVLEKQSSSPQEGEGAEAIWVVSEGERVEALNPEAMSILEHMLSQLTAVAVVNPEKKEIWGLDAPEYHLIAHRENGKAIELSIAQPNITSPVYLQRMDNDNESYYALLREYFYTVFIPGGELFTLPGLQVDAEAITRIAYTSPDESVELEHDGEVWSVVNSSSDTPPNQRKMRKIARTLASWQAADYADASTDTGFSTSQYGVTFSTESGEHRITLGNESLHIQGRYAQLDGAEDVLVMDKKSFKAIFLSQEDLHAEDPDPDEAVTKELQFKVPTTGQSTGHSHGNGQNHNH